MRAPTALLIAALSALPNHTANAQDIQGQKTQKRSAGAILAALDKLPKCELAGGSAHRYTADNIKLARQRTALIEELCRDHPEHERTPRLARRRWTLMTNLPLIFTTWDGPLGKELDDAMMKDPGSPAAKKMIQKVVKAGQKVLDKVLLEVEKVVRESPKSALAAEAYYPRARLLTGLVIGGDRSAVDRAKGAVYDLLKRGTKADREGYMAPRLLMWLADHGYENTNDPARVALLRQLVELFPNSSEATSVAGKLRQIDALGKPFPLRFADAITGRQVDLADMKGKVVVLDFWATWCVPCKAALPHLEKLYARYRERGLEIIGISLDNAEEKGGLKALRRYVRKRKLPWPQYYLGGNVTPFTRKWGINSIPQLFVIDAKGNLHSTDARERLDKMIPALLAARKR